VAPPWFKTAIPAVSSCMKNSASSPVARLAQVVTIPRWVKREVALAKAPFRSTSVWRSARVGGRMVRKAVRVTFVPALFESRQS
jgi:hypothetical protein